MHCTRCGQPQDDIYGKFCCGCGNPLELLQISQGFDPNHPPDPETAFVHQKNLSGDGELKPYYQQKFMEFDRKGGRFHVSWNWFAFLFGIFWYLSKGMWGKPLIGIGLVVTLILLTNLPFQFLLPIYTGLFGNYDYYLLKRKNTQWW